jgi:excisionase family DNA binding protein
MREVAHLRMIRIRRTALQRRLERARSEYAELVALRIPKNDPGLLALSYVRSRGSKREQSVDLGVSVVRSEVEVQAILRRLRLRDRDEKESRKPIRGGSDLELVGVVVHDNPAECVSPPESEGTWVARIDDRLLPLKAHEPIVEKAPARCAPERRARSHATNEDPRTRHPPHRSSGGRYSIDQSRRTVQRYPPRWMNARRTGSAASPTELESGTKLASAKEFVLFCLRDALTRDVTATDISLDRPLLLRVPDVAALLGVGRSTVYELIAVGELETVHIGRSCRVPLAALEEYVSRLRASAR